MMRTPPGGGGVRESNARFEECWGDNGFPAGSGRMQPLERARSKARNGKAGAKDGKTQSRRLALAALRR